MKALEACVCRISLLINIKSEQGYIKTCPTSFTLTPESSERTPALAESATPLMVSSESISSCSVEDASESRPTLLVSTNIVEHGPVSTQQERSSWSNTSREHLKRAHTPSWTSPPRGVSASEWLLTASSQLSPYTELNYFLISFCNSICLSAAQGKLELFKGYKSSLCLFSLL